MGQKVNPHGLRVGVIKDWDSKWYAEGDFADYLVEDYNIRTFLKKKLYAAVLSNWLVAFWNLKLKSSFLASTSCACNCSTLCACNSLTYALVFI